MVKPDSERSTAYRVLKAAFQETAGSAKAVPGSQRTKGGDSPNRPAGGGTELADTGRTNRPESAFKPSLSTGRSRNLAILDLGFHIVYDQLHSPDSPEHAELRDLARKIGINPHAQQSGSDSLLAFYLPQISAMGKEPSLRLGCYLAAGQGYANAIQAERDANARQNLVTRYQNEYKSLIEVNLIQTHVQPAPSIPDLAGPVQELATSYSLFVEKVRSLADSSRN